MSVTFKNVSKRFPGGTMALDNLNFSFDHGEFVVFLGPSGSGKTTACRVLAGLEMTTEGCIELDGRDITDLAPRERNMSMVFQNYALYSHRSVFENIAYPLRIRKKSKEEIDKAVKDVATLLQIQDYLHRRPKQLSGGQAQRVAVARALVWQPAICLMDEPLSNLDAILRLQTRTELKRLHEDLGSTFVFVTHDQEEAMTLGTRIVVLDQGRLIQFDTPRKIYHEPATRFVAQFIGRPAMNCLEGNVAEGVFACGQFRLPTPGRPNGPVVLGIRPERIYLSRPDETPSDDQTVDFMVDVVEVMQPDTLLFVKKGETTMIVRAMEDCSHIPTGSTVTLVFPPDALHFFDLKTGERLP